MGILNKISNRHLLVGLVGLGVLNAVLCLMYMMREKSNATEIAKLSGDLKLASDKHHSEALSLASELDLTRVELVKTREKLTGDLKLASEIHHSQAKKLADELALTRDKLGKTRERLDAVEKTLNKLASSENREK
jgi:hypothetical protein